MRTLAVLAISWTTSAGVALGQVAERWAHHLTSLAAEDPAPREYAEALAVGPEGSIVVTGTARNPATGLGSCVVVRYSAEGPLWQVHYDWYLESGLAGGPEGHIGKLGRDVAVDRAGNIFVVLDTPGELQNGVPRGSAMTLLEYSPAGELVWQRGHSVARAIESVSAKRVAVDPSGAVYVCGEILDLRDRFSDDHPRAALLVNCAPGGEELWARRYPGPQGFTWPADLAVDEEGNAYVTGETRNGDGDLDYVTIKYRPDGMLVYEVFYDAGIGGDDRATAIAVDSAGNAYVTGFSQNGQHDPASFADFDYQTVKYDPYGAVVWEARFDGKGPRWKPGDARIRHSWDHALDIAVDAEQNAFVTGGAVILDWPGLSTRNPPRGEADRDWVTIKYTAGGVEDWIAVKDRGGWDTAYVLALDHLGNVYVAGALGENAGYVLGVVKYSAKGRERWERGHQVPEEKLVAWGANGLGVTDDLGVYVAGQAHNEIVRGDIYDQDYVVIHWSPHRFIRGDCNGDGSLDAITDAVFLLRYLFLGSARPPCLAACDVDFDGDVSGEPVDAVALLRHAFLGGAAPPAPYPGCGPLSLAQDEDLGCATETPGCE